MVYWYVKIYTGLLPYLFTFPQQQKNIITSLVTFKRNHIGLSYSYPSVSWLVWRDWSFFIPRELPLDNISIPCGTNKHWIFWVPTTISHSWFMVPKFWNLISTCLNRNIAIGKALKHKKENNRKESIRSPRNKTWSLDACLCKFKRRSIGPFILYCVCVCLEGLFFLFCRVQRVFCIIIHDHDIYDNISSAKNNHFIFSKAICVIAISKIGDTEHG